MNKTRADGRREKWENSEDEKVEMELETICTGIFMWQVIEQWTSNERSNILLSTLKLRHFGSASKWKILFMSIASLLFFAFCAFFSFSLSVCVTFATIPCPLSCILLLMLRINVAIQVAKLMQPKCMNLFCLKSHYAWWFVCIIPTGDTIHALNVTRDAFGEMESVV